MFAELAWRLGWIAAVTASLIAPALAEGFDQDKAGATPGQWSCGVTGDGTPIWTVQRDSTAPSRPHVLVQSGRGAFPWCVRPDVELADGFVEVMFKPLTGQQDQAGGVIWRWADANNFYVARANALENNVSLYRMQQGRRITLKYVDAPVPGRQWSTLRVEFEGRRIRVLLNRKLHIEFEDPHASVAGNVGVWTKSDSVTAFDEFSFGDLKAAR
jgi:hypothetical protein